MPKAGKIMSATSDLVQTTSSLRDEVRTLKAQVSDRDNTITQMKEEIQGAISIRKTVLPGMAIPMLKIRRPNGRLIFNMEIAILR